MKKGGNKAAVIVAHSMLIAIYHMIKGNVAYTDLGADYYSKFNKEKEGV